MKTESRFLSPYRDVLQSRSSGFDAMFLNLERHTNPCEMVIVETGCVRKDSWGGDGCSTVLFHEFSMQHNCRFISIDNNPEHCGYARLRCPGVEVICADSLNALSRFTSSVPSVNLLYLDSYDIDWNHPHPSALHHLKELCAAMPMLKRGAMVFVDDNNKTTGKGAYVKDFMLGIGAELIHDSYQIGFRL